MNASDWIALASGLVALVAAGLAVWQARTAAASAEYARRQAAAADEQTRVAREQLQQAERMHREQLDFALRVNREQSEPYVVVDILCDQPGSQILVLKVQNVGPTVARNVRIKFTPDLTSSYASFTEGLHRALSRPFPVIPPGRVLRWFMDVAPQRFESDMPLLFDVVVEADGPVGPVEPMHYQIDLDLLRGTPVGERPTRQLEKTMGEVASAISSLGSSYKTANAQALREERERQFQEDLRRDRRS